MYCFLIFFFSITICSCHKLSCQCFIFGVISNVLSSRCCAVRRSEAYQNAPFTTFSVTLGHMIKEVHRCLLLALASENSPLAITQIIKVSRGRRARYARYLSILTASVASRRPVRFSHLNVPLFQNLEFIWSIVGSSNYRPSAPFLYEVASHVENCHFGDY